MNRFLSAVLRTLVLLLASATVQAQEREQQIIHQLLDLDQSALFTPEDHSPLRELEAWAELYSSSFEQAMADNSEDQRGLKMFMLIGWVAFQRNDFGTMQSFTADFRDILDAKPAETLRAMAATGFMVPVLCAYLGRSFTFEDADPAERSPFLARHEEAMLKALGGEQGGPCVEVIRMDDPG